MGYGLCETSGIYPAKCFLNWNLAFVLILKWGVFGTQGENCPIQDTEDVLHEKCFLLLQGVYQPVQPWASQKSQ